MYTTESATEYLSARAAVYGGEFADILLKTPTILWDSPDELVSFWEGRDLSHVYPKSLYPHLADDWSNIVAEDPGINRARGAEVMTELELDIAQLDNDAYAQAIDSSFDNDSVEVLEEVVQMII